MTAGRLWAIGVLLTAIVVSATGVIYAKHELRLMFAEKQTLIGERDDLNIEWGRLQLEQSTWGAQSRVEQIARDRLNMEIPSPDSVVFVDYGK